MNSVTEKSFTNLRTKYFPKHRNHLPSHLTFFHALPAEHLEIYKKDLHDLCSRTPISKISTGPPFTLRAGVAVSISSVEDDKPTIEDLHARLLKRWREVRKFELTSQDQQALHQPHITIQNKVENQGEVKDTFEAISKNWKNRKGKAQGFELYVAVLSCFLVLYHSRIVLYMGLV